MFRKASKENLCHIFSRSRRRMSEKEFSPLLLCIKYYINFFLSVKFMWWDREGRKCSICMMRNDLFCLRPHFCMNFFLFFHCRRLFGLERVVRMWNKREPAMGRRNFSYPSLPFRPLILYFYLAAADTEKFFTSRLSFKFGLCFWGICEVFVEMSLHFMKANEVLKSN